MYTIGRGYLYMLTDKKKKQAITVSIIYLALAFLGMFFVSLRGLSNLLPVYIINISVDLFGMLTGYVLFICCLFDVQKTGSDERYFLYMLNVTYLGLFTDMIAWLVDGIPGLRIINIIDNTLYYMCMPLDAFFFWHYVISYIRLEDRLKKNIQRILQIGIIVATLDRMINLFTGIFFTVDTNGVYSRSPLYPISMTYAFFTSAATIVLIIVHRKEFTRQKLIPLLLYIFTPTAASIFTLAVFGLSISYGLIMLVLLLIYCIINIDQGRQKAMSDRELHLASAIQEHILPHVFPAFPDHKEFDLYASMDPAKEVGGDFYDFFLTDDDHLAMVIADVSGKGVPAALFMMISKALIKNSLLNGNSPAKALDIVNKQIAESNPESMFVTVWVALLELSTGKGVAANAGHENPFLGRAGGPYEMITYKHDPILGLLEDFSFKEHEFVLNPGDSFFVYTDGVSESENMKKEAFGTTRILETLNASPGASPDQILTAMAENIREFTSGTEPFDDITMLCMQYKGK